MAKQLIIAIEFDVRDWDNGFWVSFRIPFTQENYERIIGIAGSAQIKLIKQLKISPTGKFGHTSHELHGL